MKYFKIIVGTLLVGMHSLAVATDWFETAGFKQAAVLESVCNGFTAFPSREPFPRIGTRTVAAGYIWVELNQVEYDSITGGVSEGIKESSVEVLSGSDATHFSGKFIAHGNVKVPFIVSLIAGGLPGTFGLVSGTTLTLLDEMISQGKSVSTATEVGILMRDGGKIVNYRAIMIDAQGHPWFFDQDFFVTTVNTTPRSYLLCETRHPVKLVP